MVPGRPGPTDAGPGVSVAGLQPDAEGRVLVPVDLTPLAHGTYELIGTFFRTTASGDVVQHAHSFPITVDREGPTAYGGYLSLGTFHPSPDGYRDRVHLVTSISSDDVDAATLRMIHDSTGHDVVVPSTLDAATDRLSAEWDGRVAGGALAPAGRWTAVVDAVDPLGNVQRTVVDGVRLTHQQVEPVRRVYTVSAQRSREDTRTWRCARVVRGPGSWTHGLGYRASTCHLQAGARTSHAFGRVPRGWIDGTIALGALGRSAETRPHRIPSEASLHLEGRRRRATRMLDTVGWYSTGARPDRSVLDTTSGKVEWDVEIDHATRYDVKAFRIVFEGRALR